MPAVPELDDMPARTPGHWFLKLLLAALTALGGLVATTAATHVWNVKADAAVVDSLARDIRENKADRATVTQMAQDIHTILESQQRLEVKVDSTNLRITQIRCGSHVANGCR